jgi:iron complex outermembrane receptor protein
MLGALALAIATPFPTYAQEAPEEIVVTARKREESLQEVPLSIKAFSAETLQQAGAINNEDVALLTVNFNTVQQLGRRLDRPTIRGQAAPAVGGEPNASYFIDGAYVSGSISTLTLGPIERVEILRGPQSTQFGRATFSGAVNYVTRRPTKEFTGELQTKMGSDDTRQIAGWMSGPIIDDTLMAFVSAGWDQYGGEWNNNLKADQADPLNFINPPQMGDSSDLGGTDTKDFQTKFLWTPNDTSEFTLKLGYTEGDDDHYVQLIQEPGELNCYLPTPDNSGEDWYSTSRGAFCGTIDEEHVRYTEENPFNPSNPDFDPNTYLPVTNLNGPGQVPNLALINNLPNEGGARQSRFNLPDFYNGMELPDFSGFFGNEPEDWIASPEEPGVKRKQYRSLFQYDEDIQDWGLMFRAAYNKDDTQQGYDLDRTEQRYFGGTFEMYEDFTRKDHSFEIRTDSPGDARLRGSVGLYYFSQEYESNQKRFVSQGDGQLSRALTQDITNYAAFGSIDYDITQQLTFSTEVRWANDKKDIEANFICEDPNSPYFGQQVTDKTDNDSLTPRFTLRYEPSDQLMFYGLAAKGNKPAEFNQTFFRPATASACESLGAVEDGGSRIEEEKAWTYETGAKSTWIDRRITANLAVFYIDWENQGVFNTIPIGGILSNVVVNAGKSEIKGLELETAFVLTNHLTANLSYGLSDSEFTEYSDDFFAKTTGIGLDPLTGNAINGSNNVKGHHLPNSPKHSVVAGLSYNHPLFAETEWFMNTNYVWESERYTSAANFTKIGERNLWNSRLGLDNSTWRVTAYVDNILDDKTPSSVLAFQYLQDLNWRNGAGSRGTAVEGNSVVPYPGRRYGLELLVRFGN